MWANSVADQMMHWRRVNGMCKHPGTMWPRQLFACHENMQMAHTWKRIVSFMAWQSVSRDVHTNKLLWKLSTCLHTLANLSIEQSDANTHNTEMTSFTKYGSSGNCCNPHREMKSQKYTHHTINKLVSKVHDVFIIPTQTSKPNNIVSNFCKCKGFQFQSH